MRRLSRGRDLNPEFRIDRPALAGTPDADSRQPQAFCRLPRHYVDRCAVAVPGHDVSAAGIVTPHR